MERRARQDPLYSLALQKFPEARGVGDGEPLYVFERQRFSYGDGRREGYDGESFSGEVGE